MRKLARLTGGVAALALVAIGTSCGRQNQQNQTQQSEPQQAPQDKTQQEPQAQQPQKQAQQAEPPPPKNNAQQAEPQEPHAPQPQKQAQQAEPKPQPPQNHTQQAEPEPRPPQNNTQQADPEPHPPQNRTQQAEPQAPQPHQPQNAAVNENANQNGSHDIDENPSEAEIRQIQKVLKHAGFKAGPLDGKLGKKTKQALRRFQQKQGLQQTGTPDVKTLAALGIDRAHRAH